MLAKERGSETSRRLAIAPDRFNRMLEALDERDREAAWDLWLNGLRVSERSAIVDQLIS